MTAIIGLDPDYGYGPHAYELGDDWAPDCQAGPADWGAGVCAHCGIPWVSVAAGDTWCPDCSCCRTNEGWPVHGPVFGAAGAFAAMMAWPQYAGWRLLGVRAEWIHRA